MWQFCTEISEVWFARVVYYLCSIVITNFWTEICALFVNIDRNSLKFTYFAMKVSNFFYTFWLALWLFRSVFLLSVWSRVSWNASAHGSNRATRCSVLFWPFYLIFYLNWGPEIEFFCKSTKKRPRSMKSDEMQSILGPMENLLNNKKDRIQAKNGGKNRRRRRSIGWLRNNSISIESPCMLLRFSLPIQWCIGTSILLWL